MKALILTTLASLTGAACAPGGAVVAHTKSGTMLGSTCASNNSTKLFQGIPYAQPPVGSLRFKPPQPLHPSHSKNVLQATTAPAPCIQFSSLFGVSDPTPSEDCLYLDVYVPHTATPKSMLPVKVWAYGGSNNGGAVSYPLYNGCNLATDAIVVSFNYRLGTLGFLSLESAGIQGNMALQDYIAALTWVHDNIAAFGGDADKVMLFGQSAGANDAFTFASLPQAKGLVRSVAVESGGHLDATPYDTAQYTGASYAETLGCSVSNLTCLQSKSTKELVDAVQRTPALLDGKLHGYALSSGLDIDLPNTTSLNTAVLDGKLIRRQPLEVGSQVPLIAGSAEQDSTLFVLSHYGIDVSEKNYTDFLTQWGPVGAEIGTHYPLAAFNASGPAGVAVLKAISFIATRYTFTCGIFRGLRATANAGVPAYAYRFAHTPSCPWLSLDGEPFPAGKLSPLFGATHTAELPFVLANLERQPFGEGTCAATEAERRMSRTLVEAWTAMAERASPETEGQKWPRLEVGKNEGLYIRDGVSVRALDFDDCEFWDRVWVQLGGVHVP